MGKVILRSETSFFTTTSHIASPSPVVHYHDQYPFYAYFTITQKVHNAFAFLKYMGCYFSSFYEYMLACIYFSEYGQRNTGPTLETELQRFVTVFIRSSLHSLWLALENAHSLLPTSNHIACRVPLCQNCSM